MINLNLLLSENRRDKLLQLKRSDQHNRIRLTEGDLTVRFSNICQRKKMKMLFFFHRPYLLKEHN